jgi:uncharacterized protein YoxC
MKHDMEIVMDNKDEVMNELHSTVPVVDEEKSLIDVPLSDDETDESKERFLPVVNELVEDVQDGLEEVVEAVEDLVEDVQDGLEEVVEAVEDVVEDVQDHSDALKEALQKEIEDVKEVVNEASQDAKDKIDEVVQNHSNVMNEITEYVDDFTNPESLEQKNNDELESSMAEGDSCCSNKDEIKCPCMDDNKDDAEPPKKKSFFCNIFGLGC